VSRRSVSTQAQLLLWHLTRLWRRSTQSLSSHDVTYLKSNTNSTPVENPPGFSHLRVCTMKRTTNDVRRLQTATLQCSTCPYTAFITISSLYTTPTKITSNMFKRQCQKIKLTGFWISFILYLQQVVLHLWRRFSSQRTCRCIQHIRGFTTMRYINSLFTYLLTCVKIICLLVKYSLLTAIQYKMNVSKSGYAAMWFSVEENHCISCSE